MTMRSEQAECHCSRAKSCLLFTRLTPGFLARSVGLLGWEVIVDLVSSDSGAGTVLRVIVVKPKLPMSRPLDLERLRTCKNYREISVGGRKAYA